MFLGIKNLHHFEYIPKSPITALTTPLGYSPYRYTAPILLSCRLVLENFEDVLHPAFITDSTKVRPSSK
jgi:hypothetical protein